MRKLMFLFALCLSFHAKAALIVWEFEIELVEFHDDLNLFAGLGEGDILTGFFGYDDGLQQTNINDYANDFESDSLVFGLGIASDVNNFAWEYSEVTVVHQSSRDIVDFEMELGNADFESYVELGFLDYNQPYGQGELPLNWHNLTAGADTPEFDFYAEDLNSGLFTEIYGEFTNITLRNAAPVPAPAAIWLIAPFALLILSRRRKA